MPITPAPASSSSSSPFVTSVEAVTSANVVGYGATGDGATDDTSAIQRAINACTRGGTVFFPPGEYKITSTLSVTKPLTLRGAGVSAKYEGIVASNTGQVPSADPWLEGSVLRMDTAATDAVTINVKGVQVDVRDLGVKFGDDIAFQDTGHGFKVYSSQTVSGGGESSVYDGRWDNVKVWGHDGDHYAFWFHNANYCHLSHLVGFGGGGLNLSTDSTQSPTGNHVVLQPWFAMFVRGTADGIHLEGTSSTHHGNGNLNLITFIRPQINVIDVTGSPCQLLGGFSTPQNQHGWYHVNDPAGIHIYDLDIEIANTLTGITNNIGGYLGGTTVHSAPVLSQQFTGGYQRGIDWLKGDQKWNAPQMDASPGRSQFFTIPHTSSLSKSASNHYQMYGLIHLPVSTITGVLFEVTTGAASTSLRVGLYEDDDGLPGDLVVDWGLQSIASTGVKEMTVSTSLAYGGRYWVSAVPQGSNTASLRYCVPICVGGHTDTTAIFGTANHGRIYYNTAGGVTGALGATGHTAANLSSMPDIPKIALRLT